MSENYYSKDETDTKLALVEERLDHKFDRMLAEIKEGFWGIDKRFIEIDKQFLLLDKDIFWLRLIVVGLSIPVWISAISYITSK